MIFFRRNITIFLAIIINAGFFSEAFAQSVINPTAQVVHLRKSCISQGTTYLNNCFETTSSLTNWLWGTSGTPRQPSPTDRVDVEVGPGDFEPFECPGKLNDSPRKGWVSVHGAGRESTRFVRAANDTNNSGIYGYALSGACRGGVHVEHCDGMEFSNIGAIGKTGIFWIGAGKAVWNDVDAIAEPRNCGIVSAGWYDLTGEATQKSLHYFFGGRIWDKANAPAAGRAGLDAISAEIWLYGTDIALLDYEQASLAYGLFINDQSDIRLFGGTVRVVGTANGSASGSVKGVEIQGGTFHAHGSIISMDAKGSTNPLTMIGINVNPIDSHAMIHTPGTDFGFAGTTSNTTVKRIVDASSSSNYGAMIMSPFLWQSGDTPPSAGENSVHGQDIFIDTSTHGTNEAHLMVRDSSCAGSASNGGGAWRDMVNGQCRFP